VKFWGKYYVLRYIILVLALLMRKSTPKVLYNKPIGLLETQHIAQFIFITIITPTIKEIYKKRTTSAASTPAPPKALIVFPAAVLDVADVADLVPEAVALDVDVVVFGAALETVNCPLCAMSEFVVPL